MNSRLEIVTEEGMKTQAEWLEHFRGIEGQELASWPDLYSALEETAEGLNAGAEGAEERAGYFRDLIKASHSEEVITNSRFKLEPAEEGGEPKAYFTHDIGSDRERKKPVTPYNFVCEMLKLPGLERSEAPQFLRAVLDTEDSIKTIVGVFDTLFFDYWKTGTSILAPSVVDNPNQDSGENVCSLTCVGINNSLFVNAGIPVESKGYAAVLKTVED